MTTGGPVDLVALYLAELLKQEGMLYCWPDPANGYSGKGLPGSHYPDTRDCSGVVTAAIYAAGGDDLRGTFGSRRMWAEWAPTNAPKPGDLCFYGLGRVNHVMTLLEDGRVFGACGGGSTTLTPQIAKDIGACVKHRSGPRYRRDFVGYRVNPLRSTK